MKTSTFVFLGLGGAALFAAYQVKAAEDAAKAIAANAVKAGAAVYDDTTKLISTPYTDATGAISTVYTDLTGAIVSIWQEDVEGSVKAIYKSWTDWL